MLLNYGRSTIWTVAHFLVAQCGVIWSVSFATTIIAPRCRTDDDCDVSLGQKCYRLYDECQIGQCMCNPKRHRLEPSGHCTPIRYGNERCSESIDVCLKGMSCINGYCKCTVGTMTPDGQYCLLPGQRLLGQRCRPSSGTSSCLRKSSTDYTKYDVQCSPRGECECSFGYKAEGITCRRWSINEFGCTNTNHCQGGAVCSEGQCICPPQYIPVAGNSKCAKLGAVIDLSSGAICDELNELRYCARSLVCHKCPDDEVFKCVNFLMTSEYSYLSSMASVSAGQLRHSHILLIPSIIILILLTTTIPFYSPSFRLSNESIRCSKPTYQHLQRMKRSKKTSRKFDNRAGKRSSRAIDKVCQRRSVDAKKCPNCTEQSSCTRLFKAILISIGDKIFTRLIYKYM